MGCATTTRASSTARICQGAPSASVNDRAGPGGRGNPYYTKPEEVAAKDNALGEHWRGQSLAAASHLQDRYALDGAVLGDPDFHLLAAQKQ